MTMDERRLALLAHERELLDRLRMAVLGFDAVPDDLQTLRRALIDLDELFSLVVIGEFNSGKSSFINTLLGTTVLEEGITPTTSAINILRYGPQAPAQILEDGTTVLHFPAPFLRDLSLVDTPGTNAIIRKHEEITRHYVPRADLVLFVTSADRPFTESERAILEKIRNWGKKIIVILNKIDLFEKEKDITTVVEFIQENALTLLGFTPLVFPISARLTRQARNVTAVPVDAPSPRFEDKSSALSITPPQQNALNYFSELEKYIFSVLGEENRLKLKLLSPLGVAERILQKYNDAAASRALLLTDDLKTRENIEAQLNIYDQELRDGLNARIKEIETIIYAMNERASEFFAEHLRLRRFRTMLQSDLIKKEFDQEVIADTQQQIDTAIQLLIDWFVGQELRLWQQVTGYLNRKRRQSEVEDFLIGEIGNGFDYNRGQLIASIGDATRQVVTSYDRRREAQQLSDDLREAVAATTLTSLGALGLGTAVVILASTAAVDLTGIAAASLIAGLGLVIIPRKRRQLQNNFQDKSTTLRIRLVQTINNQFTRELKSARERIDDAIAPFSRFIKAEQDKVTRYQATFQEIEREIARLKEEIGPVEG